MPISSRALAKAELHALAARGEPAELIDCDLRGADLARLDLSGWRFAGADLRGAALSIHEAADLARFKGARVSLEQAAEMLTALGLEVA